MCLHFCVQFGCPSTRRLRRVCAPEFHGKAACIDCVSMVKRDEPRESVFSWNKICSTHFERTYCFAQPLASSARYTLGRMSYIGSIHSLSPPWTGFGCKSSCSSGERLVRKPAMCKHFAQYFLLALANILRAIRCVWRALLMFLGSSKRCRKNGAESYIGC